MGVSRAVTVSMVLVATGLVLAGCGRRGALEAPPGATAAPAPVERQTDPFTMAPLPAAERPVDPGPAVRDRPFFLDALL